jgi:hypothetical protein
MTREDKMSMKAAIEAGKNTYRRTAPCEHGHFERYLSGPCVKCTGASNQRRRTGRPRGRPRKTAL